MKQICKHTVGLILMGYFLIAGLGFNVVNYCCETCEKHGIVEVATNSCGDIHHTDTSCCDSSEHHQSNDHNPDLACDNISHHPNSCHLLRMKVETPTHASTGLVKVNIHSLELTIPYLIVNLANIQSTDISNDVSPPDTPLAAGRTILTNKSVLII